MSLTVLKIAKAIKIIAALVKAARAARESAYRVSVLVKQAHAQNRTITKAELDTIVAADDAARESLAAAIERAKAKK